MLWLYLARRDSKGVRIIAVLSGKKQPPVRLANIESLQLPASWQSNIEQIIEKDKLLWQPWIESADTYDDLKSSLKKRGFSGIPTNGNPELTNRTVGAIVTSLPKPKTMTRKAT